MAASEMSVRMLFAQAGLLPKGPGLWGEPLPERLPGVYAVSIVSDPEIGLVEIEIDVPTHLLGRWLRGPVIYVGRTGKPLSSRLGQFYRHKHGQRSPHRGGQDVLLLSCVKWVFWSAAADPAEAEHKMIEAFHNHLGALPFANRRREYGPAADATREDLE